MESGEKERSQRESTIFSLGVENEQANVGRDGRPVSRDEIIRREQRREKSFSLFS